MEGFLEFVKSDNFLIMIFFINLILILAVLFCIFKILRMRRNYVILMNKIGNGDDLDAFLKNYLKDVEKIKKDNSEIKTYCTKLDNNLETCIQKIGLVRYNAFPNVGSDLSFAIALLDKNDNGVVFNGLYGADSSNIYAKPIKNGESQYQLSDEEKYAIDIAEQNKNFEAKHKSNQLYKEI